jgi:TolA-binding protein
MKATERHKLKENEFARSVAKARQTIDTRGRDITRLVIAVVAVLLVAGAWTLWRQSKAAKANTSLASALAVYEAPVVTPTAPAPGSPMPVPQPGTYQTEQAKLEAALPKFVETASTYPGTDAGITAEYHAAGILASLGRHPEAEQRYQAVIDKAGSRIYARTSRLGLAASQVAQGKFDAAIATYTELTRDTNSTIPVDGVLMQLGRAYAQAGRKEEAARAFNRVVEEFPQSLYVADARREMEEAQKG